MANQNQVKQELEKTDNKIVSVYDFMQQNKNMIAKALPKAITPDRMIAIFTMVIKSSPELMACSQLSLVTAVLQTIQLGLLPGATSQVYYVPFNNKKKDGTFQKEVQFILGYRGMIELINRSREAAILSAECVYEKDEFEYSFGLNPVLNHKPAKGDRGGFVGVYCIAKNKIVDEKLFNFLSKEEIEKVRNASKAGQSDFSPWAKWFDEMAKKTAIKRMAKLLPLSVDIQKGLAADETIKTEIAPDMLEVRSESVYDEDMPTGGSVAQNKPIPEASAKDKIPFDQFIRVCEEIGEEKYYTILGDFGYEKAEQITKLEEANKILAKMREK